MPSAGRRAKLLEDFRDAERQYRYYYRLSNHYLFWRRALRLGLLLATSGTVVVAVQGSEAGTLALGLITAGIMALDHTQDYARKAAVAFAISESCAKLTDAYHELWIGVEAAEVDDDHLAGKLREFGRELSSVTYRSGYAELTEHDAIHEAADAEADAIMAERTGVEQGRSVAEDG